MSRLPDIHAKIDAGDYETKIPYDYVMVPVDKDTMTIRQAEEHVERERLARSNHRRKRDEDDSRLVEMFRADIAKCCGVVGHPKESKLWNMAYEYGHSSGLREIASYYDDLADLVT